MKALLLFCTALLGVACATNTPLTRPDKSAPKAPDYFDPNNWAALPTKSDAADRTPMDTMRDQQVSAEADVFFLHPTTYTGKRGDAPWNASTFDLDLNKKTDASTILYQASLFNAAGRIYAPRYRQAHLSAYFTEDTLAAKQAFEVAYSDVKRAFEHYLQHYNKNRPIIIAAHSQGTTHGKRLLREFFEGKALQNQLVAAYLVGIPVEADYFQELKPCSNSAETGCFVSWRTYQKGHFPEWHQKEAKILVVNPLTWNLETSYAANTLNKGAVLQKFDMIYPNLVDAQIEDGFLWISKPKFPWSFLYRNPNYHIGDYNLFYLDVRHNAVQRVQAFLQKE